MLTWGPHLVAMERSTIFNGKIHYKWPFSIAMLVHQRVFFRVFECVCFKVVTKVCHILRGPGENLQVVGTGSNKHCTMGIGNPEGFMWPKRLSSKSVGLNCDSKS